MGNLTVAMADATVTDVLSWLPVPSSSYALPENSWDLTLCHITGEGLTLTKIQTDAVLSKVVKFVQTEWPPKAQITIDLLRYYHIHDELHLKQCCLVQDCQFVAPAGLHIRILGPARSGHPGLACKRCIP